MEIKDSDASGGELIYFPDDAVRLTVTNLNPLVTAQKSQGGRLTDDVEFELTMTDSLDGTIL